MAEPSPGRRGPYAKSERTRESILEAAFAVFAEAGYRAGSLREIAARAGMSEAGLLHHFPSKPGLLLAVLEYRESLSESRFGLARRQSRDQLRTLVELAEYNATVPGIVQLYAMTAVDATSPEHPAHEHFATRFRTVVGYLRSSLDDLRRSGQLRPDVDPALAARHGIALWDGLQTQWLYDPGEVDVAAELRRYFDTLLVTPLE